MKAKYIVFLIAFLMLFLSGCLTKPEKVTTTCRVTNNTNTLFEDIQTIPAEEIGKQWILCNDDCEAYKSKTSQLAKENAGYCIVERKATEVSTFFIERDGGEFGSSIGPVEDIEEGTEAIQEGIKKAIEKFKNFQKTGFIFDIFPDSGDNGGQSFTEEVKVENVIEVQEFKEEAESEDECKAFELRKINENISNDMDFKVTYRRVFYPNKVSAEELKCSFTLDDESCNKLVSGLSKSSEKMIDSLNSDESDGWADMLNFFFLFFSLQGSISLAEFCPNQKEEFNKIQVEIETALSKKIGSPISTQTGGTPTPPQIGGGKFNNWTPAPSDIPRPKPTRSELTAVSTPPPSSKPPEAKPSKPVATPSGIECRLNLDFKLDGKNLDRVWLSSSFRKETQMVTPHESDKQCMKKCNGLFEDNIKGPYIKHLLESHYAKQNFKEGKQSLSPLEDGDYILVEGKCNVIGEEFRSERELKSYQYVHQRPDAEKIVEELRSQGIRARSLNGSVLVEYYKYEAGYTDDEKKELDYREGDGEKISEVPGYCEFIMSTKEYNNITYISGKTVEPYSLFSTMPECEIECDKFAEDYLFKVKDDIIRRLKLLEKARKENGEGIKYRYIFATCNYEYLKSLDIHSFRRSFRLKEYFLYPDGRIMIADDTAEFDTRGNVRRYAE